MPRHVATVSPSPWWWASSSARRPRDGAGRRPVRRARLAGPRRVLAAVPVGAARAAASCGWTATSPSRAGCWSPACCGAPSSPPSRVILFRASAARRRQRARQPRRGRAGHRGGHQGRLPAAAAVVAPRTSSTACWTASSTPAWSASASPSPRTSSTSPPPTTAPTASARAAPTALTAHLRPPLPDQPVRAPALHRLHRASAWAWRSPRAAAGAGRWRRSPASLLAALLHGAVERLDLSAPATSSSSTSR